MVKKISDFLAAHCIRDKGSSSTLEAQNLRIYLGRSNFSNPNERNYIKQGASKIIIHPEWREDEESFDADIAIIKMRESVIFTDYISPICLPTSSINVFDVYGSVAGYGLTELSFDGKPEKAPKFIRIPTVSQEECLFDNTEYAKRASRRTFCAGEKGKIPCK